jgi:hypothetical protein
MTVARSPGADQAVRDLEQRIGQLYDLDELANFLHVGRRAMRRTLQQEGVSIIELGRKQLVQRELAEKALGLDFAELQLDLHRNEAWMREREIHADGRRKSVAEYADEMSATARQVLRAVPQAEQR